MLFKSASESLHADGDKKTEAQRGLRIKNVNISAKRVTLTLPEIGLIAMIRARLALGLVSCSAMLWKRTSGAAPDWPVSP